MKLYLLLIPLLAAMACVPSVSQDEYDGLSADFRQSQTEVSELKSQLNIADSQLAELERQITGLSNHRSGVEISNIEVQTIAVNFLKPIIDRLFLRS